MADATRDRSSRRVVYASRCGCALDADMAGGGTDDAAAIQAALDALGTAGGGVFVLDGDANVGASLRLDSRVTFDGVGVGKLWMKAGVGGPAIRNRHWISSYNGGSPVYDGSTILDTDICVRNLYVNGNRANASGSSDPRVNAAQMVMAGLQFHGVRRLHLENNHFHDCQFGVHGSNLFTVTGGRNGHVDPFVAGGGSPANRLTVVFQLIGPLDDVTLRDTYGTVGDDAIGLTAQDVNTAAAGTWDIGGNTINPASAFYGGLGTCYKGPITNVLIDGIRADRCLSGFRIHSGDATTYVDNVEVRSARGTFFAHAGVMEQFLPCFAGDYRRVTMRDISMNLAANIGVGDAYIKVGGTGGILRFLDINCFNRDSLSNQIYFNNDVNIGLVVVSIDATEKTSGSPSPLVAVTGGTIRHLDIERANWHRDSALAVVPTSVLGISGGTVDEITMGNVRAERVQNVLDFAGGTIGSVKAGQVFHDSVGSAAGSFKVANGLTLPLLWVGAYEPGGSAAITELVGTGAITTKRGAGFYSGVPTIP